MMNRRNFLKLLGLTALPIPALAAATVEPTVETVDELVPDSADWMILQTPQRGAYSVEIDNRRVSCLRDEMAEDTKQHIKWQAKMLANVPPDNQFLLVSKKSMVYVTAPSGQRVWFHPQWDAVGERFETVVIELETRPDIFMSMDDTTILESKVITMTARNTDGKLITKSIHEVNA